MKLFDDPNNITTLTSDALPDPATVDDRTLKAIISLFIALDLNPAIEEDEALSDRIDEWLWAIQREDARRHPSRSNKWLREWRF